MEGLRRFHGEGDAQHGILPGSILLPPWAKGEQLVRMNPDTGVGLLLPAYAAAFLGSSMFRVGVFTPIGTALGALYLQIVGTGLTILNLSGPVVEMIQGGILVAAVLVSRLTRPDEH